MASMGHREIKWTQTIIVLWIWKTVKKTPLYEDCRVGEIWFWEVFRWRVWLSVTLRWILGGELVPVFSSHALSESLCARFAGEVSSPSASVSTSLRSSGVTSSLPGEVTVEVPEVEATSRDRFAASCCSRFCFLHLARRFLNHTCKIQRIFITYQCLLSMFYKYL